MKQTILTRKCRQCGSGFIQDIDEQLECMCPRCWTKASVRDDIKPLYKVREEMGLEFLDNLAIELTIIGPSFN